MRVFKVLIVTALFVGLVAPAVQAVGLSGTGSNLSIYMKFDGNLTATGDRVVTPVAFKGLTTAPNYSVTPRYATGKLGQAGDFQSNGGTGGVTDWAVDLGNLNSPWYWNGASWSINMWVSSTQIADRSFFGWQDYSVGSNKGFSLSNHPSQTFLMGNGVGTKYLYDANPAAFDGNWHMMSIVAAPGGYVDYYLDGSLVRHSTSVNTWWAGSSGYDTLIGASGLGKYAGTAKIDDLGIWFTRELTASDISLLYNSGAGRTVDTVVPNMTVYGNGYQIANNDPTPSPLDFTDFGLTPLGTPVDRVFRITNTGVYALGTSNLQVPTGYSIVEPLSASIAAGGFDEFTVRFLAGTTGIKSGQITFASDDPNKTSYAFNITGDAEIPVAEPSALSLVAFGLLGLVRRRK